MAQLPGEGSMETTQDKFLSLFQAIERLQIRREDIIHRDLFIMAGSFIVEERRCIIHVCILG